MTYSPHFVGVAGTKKRPRVARPYFLGKIITNVEVSAARGRRGFFLHESEISHSLLIARRTSQSDTLRFSASCRFRARYPLRSCAAVLSRSRDTHASHPAPSPTRS